MHPIDNAPVRSELDGSGRVRCVSASRTSEKLSNVAAWRINLGTPGQKPPILKGLFSGRLSTLLTPTPYHSSPSYLFTGEGTFNTRRRGLQSFAFASSSMLFAFLQGARMVF